ncbi:Transcription factor MYBS3, partial [Bienertia sinuspersici]
EQWPQSDLPKVGPPAFKRGIGRPPRNRRREEDEKKKGIRSKTVKCSICGHFGHNAKTCKGAPTAKELGLRVVKNKRKSSKKKKAGSDELASISQPQASTSNEQLKEKGKRPAKMVSSNF